MEPLFVEAEIIVSPDKNDILLFHSSCFECDYDHYSTVAFASAL